MKNFILIPSMQIILVVFLIIALDQAAKIWAKANLEPIGQIPLLGDWLKFTFTENTGIAFGIELGGQTVVTALSIVATIGISLYLYSLRRDNIYYKLAFACILGGAIGNLIDRAIHGRVVDFIHFDLYHGYIFGKYYLSLWPIFNIADIAISTGVGIMFVWYKQIFEPELNPPSQPNSTPSQESKVEEKSSDAAV
jgi:signal peptidase II